jgi:hypothetical protein
MLPKTGKESVMVARVQSRPLTSIKLATSLVDDARETATLMKRSVSGQVEYWAELGRKIEAAPGFTMDRVSAALQGKFDPGMLTPDERRNYYDLLDDDLGKASDAEVRAIAAVGRQAGAAGYDHDGQLVKVGADGKTTAVPE